MDLTLPVNGLALIEIKVVPTHLEEEPQGTMKNLGKIKKLQQWNGTRANSAAMCGMLAMACALSACLALGQERVAAVRHAPPSNPQLASPAIEKRVDALLKQMTLEEKLGQLVQYSDSGYDGEAQTAAEAAAAPGRIHRLTTRSMRWNWYRQGGWDRC